MDKSVVLEKYWGYNNFRPKQAEIIDSVLAGRDTMALLPTGGGKSICFQVPALMLDGVCIVITPLIALMNDQVDNLKKRGINATAIHSGLSKREIGFEINNCIYGDVKFLYLSPERLLTEVIQQAVITGDVRVSMLVVDEAHCVSAWGYDFRPAYLKIPAFRKLLPEVALLALTASATRQMRHDILEKLEMHEPAVFTASFKRANLGYVVRNSDNVNGEMLRIIRNTGGAGIIYVRNRKRTEETADFLKRHGIDAAYYHAGLPAKERTSRQKYWTKAKDAVVIATNAFGMGIDKPDVRFVVHLDLPESLEAYYQEAGRAGRDDKTAYAVLLVNKPAMASILYRLENNFPDIKEIKLIYSRLYNFAGLGNGAGAGVSIDFDLLKFCQINDFTPAKVLNAIKYLAHDQYLTLSENVTLAARFKIIVNHTVLYEFQIANKKYDPLIKQLLRLYGGASFEYYTNLNEEQLATRLATSVDNIKFLLDMLKVQDIIDYIPFTDKPQLFFLQPKYDPLHFTLDAVFIRNRQKIEMDSMRAVLAYAEKEVCRSVQILTYFGEDDAAKCGRCDVCVAERRAAAEKSGTNDLAELIDYQLITALQQEARGLDNLITMVKAGNSRQRIDRIRYLLDSGKIKTDGDKYYCCT